ncbi:MAG: L-rhamnose/proton symporter RhaT [Bryobacteraceae bacterium]
MSDLWSGLALVLAGGLCQGSFMAPSKWIRGWAWENYWLLFAVSAYLICPWALALTTIPHLLDVYSQVSAHSFLVVALFGSAWGIGAVTFGLGVDALGVALGFAVILGVATMAGTLIPLIANPPTGFGLQKAVLMGSALLLMLAGVAVCSWAGKWKESAGAKSYRRGVLICVTSGFLSACGNLGFNFGAEVIETAKKMGVADHLAASALWTLLTLPLFLCNSAFASWRLVSNGTAALYKLPGSAKSTVLGLLMGLLWMSGMAFYGAGARTLGPLGPSLGWAILMSSMVLVANLVGFIAGEWAEAPAAAKRRLFQGLGLLVVSIALLGAANSA